ncbi:hypothetical protein [Streptomyces milbemycinicus]|uniref:DUF320 domain-containing protein n=1 Tax=Streptomyces milbemycinicus TaxID=476552 RepID=A0ABW8LZD9_9ACTN
MQIGKRAAVMAVAAGAMIIGAAGATSAYGVGVQSSSCDTKTGSTLNDNVTAPTGDIDVVGTCNNISVL